MERWAGSKALPGVFLALIVSGCNHATAPPMQYPGSPALLAAPATADAPRRSLFPPTRANAHLNLVFNYAVRNVKREIGVVDVVWGASSPNPPQVFNQFYTPFEREGSYAQSHHSLTWWKRYHPDWIEYRCDRTTIAWEFREYHAVPLDIANPAFLQFQRDGAIDAAFRAGYRGIDFDNLSLGNFSRRCGHFNQSHAWVVQYTGDFTDPAFSRDVIAWARSTYAYIHAYASTGTMAMNYSYQSVFGFQQNLSLVKQTDEVLDERGFTNWGQRRHVTTPLEWSQITRMLRALQANKTCYMENGEEPPLSQNITQAERLWVVSNYLLTRDDCTYVWMSGFSVQGGQQYGRLLIYPEYRLDVGAPKSAAARAGLGWRRPYERGLALVNPSDRAVTFRFGRTLYDEDGNAYADELRLSPATGQILLTSPP